MYTHSQTNLSVKKQAETTCPIVEPWRTLKISIHSTKTTPQSEQKRRERPTRNITVISGHFVLNSYTELTLPCQILQIKAFYQLWGRKGFFLPWFSIAYGWGWGRNPPTSPHRRLANVPMACISSITQLHFYSLIFMPVWESCFSPPWKSSSEGICCHQQVLYVVTISYEARL